jgi:5-formyltetrahydrofolate cyclo-ligase
MPGELWLREWTLLMPNETPPDSADALAHAKLALRRQWAETLGRLSAADRARASVLAGHRLRGQRVWREAGYILFYAPRADEIDLGPLLDQALAEGRGVALPRFDTETQTYCAAQVSTPLGALAPGKFGIREPAGGFPPVPLNRLDLVLVPGVAFDRSGRRLGRGRGFYDRLLAGVRGIKCGVGFDEQVQPKIPVEPHDVLLDCMVTPGFWLEWTARAGGDDLIG